MCQQPGAKWGRDVDGRRGLGRPLFFGWGSGSPSVFCLSQTVVVLGCLQADQPSEGSVVQIVPLISQ